MTAHYADEQVTLYAGDCLDVLRFLPGCSVDAVVTDPPYELGFMGRAWDASGIAYNVDLWRECLRVLRPGGHLAAFGGTRTYHRMACAVEDAGFEIRDGLQWLYGSGVPKSLDVGKAIDRIGGVHPGWKPEAYARAVERSGFTHADVDRHLGLKASSCYWARTDHRAAVPLHKHWDMARDFLGLDDAFASIESPAKREVIGQGFRIRRESDVQLAGLSDGEYDITAPASDAARQWSGWGTALKPAHEPIVLARKPLSGTVAATVLAHGTGALHVDACRTGGVEGRWPVNVLLDEGAAAELDEQSAGVSRFFPSFRYQAKAPTAERPKVNGVAHPTCKPLAVMAWLVKLLTPPGGTVLEPFAGSGTTIEAAMLEGFRVIGIEREADYLPLIEHRIARARETAAQPEEVAPALFAVGEAS